jgi:ADP-heptose:LPS heptosyltransferase
MGWAAICRLGGIGDNLIATSVLPGLKAKYGKVEVITGRGPNASVFEHNPHIDKLTFKDDGDFPGTGPDDWQKWFAIRAKEYDAFYHLSHSCEMIRALFTGQTQFFWPDSMRRKHCFQNYLETVHDICELPYAPIGPEYYPTDEEVGRAKQDKNEKIRQGRPGPVIGWVCSGTRIDKRHPRGHIAVARLIGELDATVALFGGPDKEQAIATEIDRQVRHHHGTVDGLRTCIDPNREVTNWPIRRSLAQLRECDLVVTVDTGPMWAVAMLPIPKIVILSHASAENITKRFVNATTLIADQQRVPCWPCHRLHNDNTWCKPNAENDGAACVSDVTVEAIVSTARAWLQNPARAREKIAGVFTSEDVIAACKALHSPRADVLGSAAFKVA